ncbi:MAG: hypothetical protein PHS99_02600 [Candidatus Marinimicrobia bacterium]|nr:hypothetical protein [Candidatus Neomarinimicrobiota bacterium]
MNPAKLIQSLQALKMEGNPVTTVYLDISSSQKLRNADIVVNNMFKQKKDKTFYKNLSEEEKVSVEKDIENINKYLNNLLPEGLFSVMIVSSSQADVWKVIHLGFLVENMMVIQYQPYIRPLLQGISYERNYAIILVDQGKAKILANRLGKKEELWSVVNLLPEDANDRGFGGMEERKNERRREEAVARHYKNIVAQVEGFEKDYHFDWIILGGLRECIADFKNYLKPELKKKISAEIPIDPNLPMDKVFLLVDKEIPQCRASYEKELLDKFADEYYKNFKGVVGLQETEESLKQGQIDMLLIHDKFHTKGRICKQCQYTTIHGEKMCPNCGNPMILTVDLTDELIYLALDTGAKIEFISSEMGDFAPLCGFLRYSK